jgi:hypothetical protein
METRTSKIKYVYNILILRWGSMTFLYIIAVLADNSIWFNYTKVETSKPVYAIGEDIYSKSYNTRNFNMTMYRNDVLYCDFGTWPQRFSEYNSQNPNAPKIDFTKGSSFWRYDSSIPKTNTQCHIQANITADIWFGIKKKQTILSNTFEIK